MMRQYEGKMAVISGAGSGIGRATALLLAKHGARIVACDIDQAGLESLREEAAAFGHEVHPYQVDVGDRESAAAFAYEVHAALGAADILVNSAGVFMLGSAMQLSLEDWDWVFSANVRGTIHLCHYFLPAMIEAGRGGHVVNLASMYGYWPSPCVAGYLTSKFAVFGYSEALREDLRRHDIAVSTVCPGIVATGLVQNMRICARTEDEATVRSAVERKYARRGFSPERVSHAIINAMRKKKGLVLVSVESHIMYRLERFAPWLSRFIARRAAAAMFFR